MTKSNFFLIGITLLLISSYGNAQRPYGQPQILIGFYNCENFYDTTNQLNVADEDFLPNSEKKYTQSVYENKVTSLAKVIHSLGVIENVNGIALLGLAEIENQWVLNKLINHPLIKKFHYQFIHFDSKDARGVDVALLFNPAQFIPYQKKSYSLTDQTHFTTYATRDILYVKGRLMNEWVHVLVNHWPSRLGGEKKSSSKRIWASQVCKKIMDSVHGLDPLARFVVMGDFNDNPSNKSMTQLQMQNPFMKMYKKGIGSLAYNDAWNLFDQILLCKEWNGPETGKSSKFSLSNYKSIVYNNQTLIEKKGRYAGYPKRTYVGSLYNAGYSDHFPVALIFTLKMAENPQ
jgi:hypothetical protein